MWLCSPLAGLSCWVRLQPAGDHPRPHEPGRSWPVATAPWQPAPFSWRLRNDLRTRVKEFCWNFWQVATSPGWNFNHPNCTYKTCLCKTDTRPCSSSKVSEMAGGRGATKSNPRCRSQSLTWLSLKTRIHNIRLPWIMINLDSTERAVKPSFRGSTCGSVGSPPTLYPTSLGVSAKRHTGTMCFCDEDFLYDAKHTNLFKSMVLEGEVILLFYSGSSWNKLVLCKTWRTWKSYKNNRTVGTALLCRRHQWPHVLCNLFLSSIFPALLAVWTHGKTRSLLRRTMELERNREKAPEKLLCLRSHLSSQGCEPH